MPQQRSPGPSPAPSKRRAAFSGPAQRNATIAFVIMCLIGLLIFAVRSSSRSGAADRADATNASLVVRGQQLYTTRCASCHGSDLGGQEGWPQRRSNGVMPASPLDERGNAWQHDDRWIFTTIKDGGSGSPSYMPAFGGGLPDDEIWAVVSYIKSTWPEPIRDAQSKVGE